MASSPPPAQTDGERTRWLLILKLTPTTDGRKKMTSVETSADGMEEKSEGGAAAGWFQGLRPKTGLILAALKTKLSLKF